MPLPASLVPALLQSAMAADTVVSKVVTVRGPLDYVNGTLQVLVLVLAVLALGAAIALLLALRAGIQAAGKAMETITSDVRPMLSHATAAVGDARAVVARLRHDAERVSDAAGAFTDQLQAAADVTARRIDDVNAVLDVVQDELEASALTALSTVRGLRLGSRAFASAMGRRRGPRRRRDADDA